LKLRCDRFQIRLPVPASDKVSPVKRGNHDGCDLSPNGFPDGATCPSMGFLSGSFPGHPSVRREFGRAIDRKFGKARVNLTQKAKLRFD
jgi:hypothetical protein